MTQVSEAYEVTLPVEPADIDRLGHVNNVVYLRWVQEAAQAHWQAIASPAEQANFLWMVLRHEIDYKQPAYLGDEIIGRTWVGSASRIRFERHTELLRGRDRVLLAKARTMWCPVDARSLRPVMVNPELRARFSTDGGPVKSPPEG
jgi:acyl-CoA thioester hydrolase